MKTRSLMCVAALVPVLAGSARAHDPGLSSARVAFEGRSIVLRLQVDARDLAAALPIDRDGDGAIDSAELDAGAAALRDMVAERVHVSLGDERARVAVIVCELDADADVVLDLRAELPPRAAGPLCYRLALLETLPRGHRHFVSVHAASGALLGDGLLHRGAAALVVPESALAPAATAAPATLARAWRFVVLGVEHVLIGFDHVLFLLTLLLAVRRFSAAIAIITSFTLAHSSTLALASLELVALPSRLVEATIAASIVWVALENVLRQQPRHRAAVTFAFGLVHGFGFASVLRELGLDAEVGVAVPLLSFNVGVELGQLAIAAVALPLLAWLGRAPALQRRVVPALSLLTAAAGAFWLCERVLG